jgi:hypothetical protein
MYSNGICLTNLVMMRIPFSELDELLEKTSGIEHVIMPGFSVA